MESGWVSVRPKVFDEKERHKFVFIVAWNDIEGKFAITCHNRTVQRRSALLEPLTDEAPAADQQAPSPVTTPKDARAGPHSVPKGKAAAKPTKVGVSHTLGSWDIVSPKVLDLEILDAVDFQLSPDEEPSEAESSSGREDFSWAGLFSVQELRAAHLQLCAVNSDLDPCLPSFPEEQSGVWTVLFGAPGVSQRETEALCYQLQVYLGHALDTCGWKILSQVLFSEGDDTEDYYESLGELRQKGYEDAQERAKRRLQEVNLLSVFI